MKYNFPAPPPPRRSLVVSTELTAKYNSIPRSRGETKQKRTRVLRSYLVFALVKATSCLVLFVKAAGRRFVKYSELT